MPYENYYAPQTFIGGQGGDWFDYGFYPPLDGRIVQKIGVWAGEWQIKAMQVWRSGSTGSDSRLFGNPSGPYREFEFEPGERIVRMSLWGNGEGTRLGWIYFKTNRGREFDFGMTSWGRKQEYPVDVGSGICVGVYGRAGSDIDAGCFVFLLPVSSAVLSDVQYPNLAFDTLGIAPKTLDSFSDYNSTSQPRNWHFDGERQVETSQSWSVSVGVEIYQEISVSAGIPEVAKVDGKFGWKVSATATHESKNTETKKLSWGESGTLLPGQSIYLQALTRVGRLPALDYTGQMEIRLQNGERFSYPVRGSYAGVDCTAVEVTDSKTGQILSEGDLTKLPTLTVDLTYTDRQKTEHPDEVQDPSTVPPPRSEEVPLGDHNAVEVPAGS
ncbi:jacalin-like lectin [Actinokineospora sp. NPDC004072]